MLLGRPLGAGGFEGQESGVRRAPRARTSVLALGVALLAAGICVLAWALGGALDTGSRSQAANPAALQAKVERSYGNLPLRFEPNRGQTDSQVEFMSRGPGYSLFLTKGEAVLSLTRSAGGTSKAATAVVRMGLIGAAAEPSLEAGKRLPGVSNYLTGKDPQGWRTGVPGYASVKYSEAYPGIDLVYHGKQRRLEYDFIVRPGADPGAIGLRLEGARRLSLARSGDLLLHTAAGTLRQAAPVAYQELAGGRRSVTSRYVLTRGNRVGFEVGAYDRSRPLVIDPVLTYSTSKILGGAAAATTGKGIAADSAGAAYVTGLTASQLPTPSGDIQQDVFVTKLNPAGSALVYQTFLGGDGDDFGKGIKVDSAGRAYVTGETQSSNFPTTPNAFSSTVPPGGVAAILSVLRPDGSSPEYSTVYTSPAGATRAEDIALDPSNKAYITGSAGADGLPTRTPTASANPLQPNRAASRDAFVAKFDPALSGDASLIYGTYIGGSRQDDGWRIAVDPSGSAYVTGATRSGGADSVDFPTTPNAFQGAHGGGLCAGGTLQCGDAFVSKLNPDATALAYSTYLGGGQDENSPVVGTIPGGIAVDSTGKAYVTGVTRSDNFPTRSPFQAARAGGQCTVGANQEPCADAFVTKIDTAASGSASLTYSSFLGGEQEEAGHGAAVDSQGRLYATGFTSSDSLPVVNPLVSRGVVRPPGGRDDTYGDGWISRVRADGGGLSFSSYLGGGGGEDASRVALDPSGDAYITGNTFSTDFPITAGAVNAANPGQGGAPAAFVTKIAAADSRVVLVGSLEPRSGQSPGGTTVVIRGTGFTGATSVKFGGVNAEKFTVNSSTQITAVSPAHAIGSVSVVVTAPSGSSPPNPSATYAFAEGSFSPTGSLIAGRTQPEAVALPSGKILAAGGSSAFGPVSGAELYDPTTGSWTPTSPLSTARCDHTLSLLPGGKVLAAGGFTDCTSAAGNLAETNTAEIYDPATGNWTAASPMAASHAGHTATALSGPACSGGSPPGYCGKVLIAGGPQTAQATSAELYDPATGNWTAAGLMNTPRSRHTATQLAGSACSGTAPPSACGKVLVTGGLLSGAGTTIGSTELYDPVANTWGPAQALSRPRANHTAAPLTDGRVLIAGGSSVVPSAETFNPATGGFSVTPSMQSPRRGHAAVSMPGGKVLLVGGFRGSSILNTGEVYDEATRSFTSAGVMTRYRDRPFAVLLSTNCAGNCGRVLIGGDVEEARRSTELYRRSAARPVPPGGGKVITGGAGSDRLVGTPFNDVINCGPGDDVVFAGGGDDVINCGPGNDRIDAGTGNDRVDAGSGNDRVDGAPGNDRLVGNTGNDTINGASGNDNIAGGAGSDVISGNEGNDVMTGGSGNDRISGNQGNDRINGNSGNDRINGNAGNDRISGSSGRDRASGSGGRDRVSGGSGNDRLSGGSGTDRLSAGSGRDVVAGGSGNDRTFGDSGNDRMSGGSGKDRMSGGSGADRMSGNSGADRISGGSGKDRLSGGSGRDRLVGGPGLDVLIGGSGRDRSKQ